MPKIGTVTVTIQNKLQYRDIWYGNPYREAVGFFYLQLTDDELAIARRLEEVKARDEVMGEKGEDIWYGPYRRRGVEFTALMNGTELGLRHDIETFFTLCGNNQAKLKKVIAFTFESKPDWSESHWDSDKNMSFQYSVLTEKTYTNKQKVYFHGDESFYVSPDIKLVPYTKEREAFLKEFATILEKMGAKFHKLFMTGPKKTLLEFMDTGKVKALLRDVSER